LFLRCVWSKNHVTDKSACCAHIQWRWPYGERESVCVCVCCFYMFLWKIWARREMEW
jgi:hypothetical protein